MDRTVVEDGLSTGLGIPVTRVIQRPGDIVVIFPRSYYMTFSFGFNCYESVNLSPIHWYEHGACALHSSRLQHHAPRIPLEEMLCKEAVLVGAHNICWNMVDLHKSSLFS